jgi:hypothetical protein
VVHKVELRQIQVAQAVLQVLYKPLEVLVGITNLVELEELQALELVTLAEKVEIQILVLEEATLVVVVALVVIVELAVLAKQMELMQPLPQEQVALVAVVDGFLVMVDMVAVV